MVVFALALAIMANTIRIGRAVSIIVLLAAQLVIELEKHEYVAGKRDAPYIGGNYAQFFSQSLFDEIAKALSGDRSSYIVASVGIHPSITQYNGFRTADAYLALYPKEYKDKFNRAVADEFSRLPSLKSYFDDWGNRIYFFSSELGCLHAMGAVCNKTKGSLPDIHLDYNINAMLDLGVKYLFSVSIISNATDLELTLLGTFENDESLWRINVYQLPTETRLGK
jgi:hypothetical protein